MISVIVPCFNEEEAIHYYYDDMEKVRKEMGEQFEY
ncbi:glycosyltransferase, partial [Streptococcus suis]